VFVVFATQDVADVANSPLKTAVVQQCLTKIYLADPAAAAPAMREVYRAFGLSDTEISLIAGAVMKRDYFYTSPLGRRLFRLDLGPLSLALAGGADHALLDRLEERHGTGAPFCRALLEHGRVNWRRCAGPDMPEDPAPAPAAALPDAPLPGGPTPDAEDARADAARLLDAVRSLPDRRGKGDGSGRAAGKIARKFGVSQVTVYRARSLLKSGDAALIEEVRQGRLPVNSAYKRLKAVDGKP
jgi:DNA-binding transcriptional ArsR family regulator